MSAVPVTCGGARGLVSDWSADRQAFLVPWGKAMLWVFLLSDTFIFGSFLTGYLTVRASITAFSATMPLRCSTYAVTAYTSLSVSDNGLVVGIARRT